MPVFGSWTRRPFPANEYGRKVTYRTPVYKSMKREGNRIIVKFDVSIHPRHGGRAKIEGVAIAGADGHFYPAEAFIAAGDSVRVSSKFVPKPVAVRYPWATHPFGTLVGAGSSGLPAAPFRTDDWEWKGTVIVERDAPEYNEHRNWIAE